MALTRNDTGVTQRGRFAVIVTKNGCGDTSGCHYFQFGNAVADVGPEAGCRLYPNPTTGKVHVEFAGKSSAPVQLNVYNSMGQRTQSLTLQPAAEAAFTLGGAPGLYWVEILRINGARQLWKLTKTE